jgi:Arc/MetJ family transcription regulator
LDAAGIRRPAGNVSRTNIDLPDELVDEVMRAFDLPTKRRGLLHG